MYGMCRARVVEGSVVLTMPAPAVHQYQLSKCFAFLRRGWFCVLGLFVLSLIRKWLLTRPSETAGARIHDDKRKRACLSRDGCNHAHGGSEHNHKQSQVLSLDRAGENASPQEIGSLWHFEGRRKWFWMHDGEKQNGWLHFCAKGSLKTNLCNTGRGSWELQSNGEMSLTFGNCHHTVFLLPHVQLEPMFELRERVMRKPGSTRGGSKARRKQGSTTRGMLDMNMASQD
jgi:hypothetical protein